MLLVENYYSNKEYLQEYIPYNILMNTGPTINTYSIYDVDRQDLFQLALVHNFTLERFIASNAFADVVKLAVAKQVSKHIWQESTIIKLYTTVPGY